MLFRSLKKDLVVRSSISGKTIVADTGVKLQQKLHQLSSGTIKFEDGSHQIIDDTKAQYIKETFREYKIGIYYNFVAELDMLKSVIGDKLTTSLEEFNTTNKWVALQIVSGREGLSLAKADHLVFLNIQFSAVSYFQAKDRMSSLERKENTIFWIFAKRGLENHIYKAVQAKKSYTLDIFLKDIKL